MEKENHIPNEEVRTVGELKRTILNLPDEMGLTSSDGPEITVFVDKENKLHISTC